MCEIVVCVEDIVGPDVYTTTSLPSPGDVLDVLEDGHVFGRMELADPRWRILSVPDMTVDAAQNLLSREPATDPAQALGPNTLQFRAFYLDLTRPMAADMKAFMGDATRAAASFVVEPSVIAGMMDKRPPVSDPKVIG